MKNQNTCDKVLKKNEILSSKLVFVLKENDSLKNKIISISKELDLVSNKNVSLKNKIELISKELEVCLNENKSLKNDLDSHVYHASIASPSSIPIACSTSSSIIKNDICALKKSVNCLGSTLSQCA